MSNYWEDIFQTYQQSWRDRDFIIRQSILQEAKASLLSNDHDDDFTQIMQRGKEHKDFLCFAFFAVDIKSTLPVTIAAKYSPVAPEISDYLQHWQETHSGSESWPGQEVSCFINNPPPFGWEVLVQLLEAASSSEILASVAARSLELVFNYKYDSTLFSRIEADARESERVQEALSYIWVNEIAETYPLWEKLMQENGYLDLNDKARLILLDLGERGVGNVFAVKWIGKITHSIKAAVDIIYFVPTQLGVMPRLKAEIFRDRLVSTGCNVKIEAY